MDSKARAAGAGRRSLHSAALDAGSAPAFNFQSTVQLHTWFGYWHRAGQSALTIFASFEQTLQGNPLLTNATDQCNPELTAALLRQFADIEIHSTLVTVWVRIQ